MKGIIRVLAIVWLLILCNHSVFAQGNGNGNAWGLQVNIPAVALINLVGTSGTSINLDLAAPSEAGLPLSKASDSSVWINYTFLKGKNSRPKTNIYAKITNGTVPSGTELNVTATTPNIHGKGNKGQSSGEVTLNTADQKVLENIKSSHTGVGVGKGSNLIYSLEVTNYALLDFDDDVTLTILYTITD